MATAKNGKNGNGRAQDLAARDDNRNSDNGRPDGRQNGGQSDDLRASPMMAHLLDALEEGTDIGHYGRLTFAMIARHFLSEDELVSLLAHQPEFDEAQAQSLLLQVQGRDYNPPKRDKILDWQSQQDFPICPTPDDPASCNVYRELKFPDGIYDNITEFYVEKAQEQQED